MMTVNTYTNKQELGAAAAKLGVKAIRSALKVKDRVTIIVATGASQLTVLENLVQNTDLAWNRIDIFHLDEYVGISADHPASFRRYLNERLVSKIENLGSFHPVNGDADELSAEVTRLNALISTRDVDVCFAGIGVNGHLAFNDPPADFTIDGPYLVVELDEACRKQQYNEDWFGQLVDVPKRAISMSIKKMLKSKKMIISVPGEVKAVAVRNTFVEEISPLFPSSILRRHSDCHLFLDSASSSLLPSSQREKKLIVDE